MTSTQSLPALSTDQARQRLTDADRVLFDAEEAEARIELNVERHGGPGDAPVSLIASLMRAHERVFIAGVALDRAAVEYRAAVYAETDVQIADEELAHAAGY